METAVENTEENEPSSSRQPAAEAAPEPKLSVKKKFEKAVHPRFVPGPQNKIVERKVIVIIVVEGS